MIQNCMLNYYLRLTIIVTIRNSRSFIGKSSVCFGGSIISNEERSHENLELNEFDQIPIFFKPYIILEIIHTTDNKVECEFILILIVTCF